MMSSHRVAVQLLKLLKRVNL
uniref:Uncharacterized protein n=1 Tax=Rhizophora mucronata TaxID=61149 RepID=A0A2P2M327_RHIMU